MGSFASSSMTSGLPPILVLLITGLAGVFVCVLRYGRFPDKVLSNAQSWLSGQQKESTETSYVDVFPPSRREKLVEVLPEALRLRSTAKALSKSTLVGLKSDYRTAESSRFIFSGFTVAEVKSLGDFPDYATLSGVPLPSPVTEFNINNALPRPYRPFRWNYHQTMAYSKMDNDYWIELESSYQERTRQRQDLFAKHGKEVLQALPGTELACKELMEMVIQFLCARYPKEFYLDRNVFHNNILNTQADLTTEHPLHVLLNHVPEDFALMMRDESTGRYIFRAGIICSSLGWTLGTKIGMNMSTVHEPVPHFKDKLSFSLDRFFTKMKTENPIQRGSWGLEIGQPLYLPEDDPEFSLRTFQSHEISEKDIHLRVDWQTLRRLPLSGAIAFNYKALFTPLREFRDEPYIPSLVLKVLNDGNEEILKYKGTWHVEHVAKPSLMEYERWQLEQGLIERNWEPRTLDEAPFFPGWKKKPRNKS